MKPLDQLRVAAQTVAALRSQWWSRARITQYQNTALVRMMKHAVTTVPFYQDLKLAPESISGPADLDRFPVIRKQDIQREPAAFVASGFDREQLYVSRTSGSSGQPTNTYFDRNAWLLCKYALKMRRVAATTGLPLLRRVMIVSEQRPEALGAVATAAPRGLGLFSPRYLSIHTPAEHHLEVLARFRPHIIYAFPSYLLDLISVAQLRGLSLPRIPTLYTSSELLTPAARQRIEAAFAGRLYDVYGSTEFKEAAWQCRHGRYHLNFESVYVESREPGASGPVVMSTLCNFAMPLLRFDIGDSAVFGSNACLCGRASPHMLGFAGREGDMIELPSGRRLSPYLLTTVIESEDSILQYRVVQTGAKSFRIEVIVRVPGQSAAWRNRVCTALAHVVDEPVIFDVREVPVLERGASGKRSVFIRAFASAV